MKKVYLLALPLIAFSCTEIAEEDRLPEWDEVVMDLDIPEELTPSPATTVKMDSISDTTLIK